MRNKFVSLKNIFNFVSKINLMTLKEALSLLKKEIEDHDVEKFKIYSTCRLIEGDTMGL